MVVVMLVSPMVSVFDYSSIRNLSPITISLSIQKHSLGNIMVFNSILTRFSLKWVCVLTKYSLKVGDIISITQNDIGAPPRSKALFLTVEELVEVKGK